MYATVKHKTFVLLDPDEAHGRWDKIIDGFIIALIVTNTLAVILETVRSLSSQYRAFFSAFEYTSVAIFSTEYILRVWSCTYREKYRHPVWGRLRYMRSSGALIDLVAILPVYLPLLFAVDLRALRLLRLFRFLRFFKIGRYTKASQVLRRVFMAKKEELVLSLLLTLVLIILASCIMYFVENEAQPDKFSSIPETMWWSVATLTTVGYGDVYPVTLLGKTLTAFISILGIGMFALPAGIIASGFSDEMARKKKSVLCNCPHCGERLD